MAWLSSIRPFAVRAFKSRPEPQFIQSAMKERSGKSNKDFSQGKGRMSPAEGLTLVSASIRNSVAGRTPQFLDATHIPRSGNPAILATGMAGASHASCAVPANDIPVLLDSVLPGPSRRASASSECGCQFRAQAPRLLQRPRTAGMAKRFQPSFFRPTSAAVGDRAYTLERP